MHFFYHELHLKDLKAPLEEYKEDELEKEHIRDRDSN